MRVSVLIPTRARPGALARCVEALARQRFDPDRLEVVVGTDGPDPTSICAATAAWSRGGGRANGLRLIEGPRAGYIEVRRRLLPELRGELLLSLNDDVEPAPDLVAVHAREQSRARAAGRPAVIVGASPFAHPATPTLLDRMLEETSLVFFYDVMDACEAATTPDRDWGFRHCYGLNFSAPLELVRGVGGFPRMPDTYGYDDLELAFRLSTGADTPVRYRPAARAVHHHRYRARDLLDREFRLGVAAFRYARVKPAFGHAVFGRDVTSPAVVEMSRRRLERERGAAVRLERSFLALDRRPAADGDGEIRAKVRREVRREYERHRPLKRYVWCQGLVHEAARHAAAARAFVDAAGRVPDMPAPIPS